MGVLFDSIKVSQEAKSQGMISELLNLDVTKTKSGTSIYDLNYYELRQELAIAKFRNRNVESSENGWF
jgi:hypothetical protein